MTEQAPMPVDAATDDLAARVSAALAGHSVEAETVGGELVVRVARDRLVEAMTVLRDAEGCRFSQLMDIAGVDYPGRAERFEVVYNLLSLSLNQRVRVKVSTDEDNPVPSVVGVWSAAGWFEREAWDLYGIYFAGHPDLRRILTDYGFEGHPLRKDFPLTGYVEVRWDDEQKRVVYEPVRLTQDFRTFDFMSPWEGMTAMQELPGDEKARRTPLGAPATGKGS